MSEQVKVQCPECVGSEDFGRREFLMTVGGTAVRVGVRAPFRVAAKRLAPLLLNTPPLPPIATLRGSLFRRRRTGARSRDFSLAFRRRIVHNLIGSVVVPILPILARTREAVSCRF